MPEEVELEAREIREKLEELRTEEQAEAKLTQGWIRLVALTTALMAVLAAVAALQAASFSNEALLLSNEAILAQTRASDTWAEYQADGIKRHEYETQALVVAANPAQASQFTAEAQREAAKQAEEQKQAQEFEAERDSARQKSNHSNQAHESFAQAVASLQVGIGLASVAALTRRREVWWLGMAFGLVGAGLVGWGFAGVK